MTDPRPRPDKRRPLPYAAAQQIDAAIMDITNAKRMIVETTNQMTQEERFRKLVQAVNNLHEALDTLKEIRRTKSE